MPVEMPAPKNRKAEYGLRGDESTIAMQLRKKMITIPRDEDRNNKPVYRQHTGHDHGQDGGKDETRMELSHSRDGCPRPQCAITCA